MNYLNAAEFSPGTELESPLPAISYPDFSDGGAKLATGAVVGGDY